MESQPQLSRVNRSAAAVLGVALALAWLSLGLFDFGHDHHDATTDEQHCVACHLQANALIAGSVAIVPLPEPIFELSVEPPFFCTTRASSIPPLRGPPAVAS